MNASVKVDLGAAQKLLAKPDHSSPCIALVATGLVVLAGTVFGGVHFSADTPIALPEMKPGADYGVIVQNGAPVAAHLLTVPDEAFLGGFHFAPGGNATERGGGDTVPAINPCSIWDQLFRPACSDPRGMTRVDAIVPHFWCDIYLTAQEHAQGTSRLGVEIADGDSRPGKPDGKRYSKFNYATAVEVLASHGKQLLSYEEFRVAAFGVSEKTAIGSDPETTKLDAPRTSKFGLMQATGNLWVWGHDGDPDGPRASFFGGVWWDDVNAGSRRADVGCVWPDFSLASFGSRGRCDHLQPA